VLVGDLDGELDLGGLQRLDGALHSSALLVVRWAPTGRTFAAGGTGGSRAQPDDPTVWGRPDDAPSPRSRVGTSRPPSAPCAPSRLSTPDTTVPRGTGSFPRGAVRTDARPSRLHGEPGHLARGPALGVGCDRDVARPRAGGGRPD